MKTLKKLQINNSRIMSNDDLKAVKGGYDSCMCVCIAGENMYTIVSWDRDCGPLCYDVYGTTAGYCMN